MLHLSSYVLGGPSADVRAAAVVIGMTQMAAQPAECVNSCVCVPTWADYDPAPLGVLRPVAAGNAKPCARHWPTLRGLRASRSRHMWMRRAL